jgi:hypothetical protein
MDCNAVGCPLYRRCPHVQARTAEQCSRLQQESDSKYLRVDDCDDGGVYEIHAQYAGVGIFKRSGSVFEVARRNESTSGTFEEQHFDVGGTHGTARPIRKLAMAPEFDSVSQKLDYLESVELRIREAEVHG